MTKTLEELRDKYLGALALAISKHDLKPDDAYEALSIIMDEALRAAEQRGIESSQSAAHSAVVDLMHEKSGVEKPPSYHEISEKVCNAIAALAQGGE